MELVSSELAALGPKIFRYKSMKSTGKNREQGYKALLFLVVGLTAFSSAVKELNQLQQFAFDASRLVAEWSDKFYPAQEVPAFPRTIAAGPRHGSPD